MSDERRYSTPEIERIFETAARDGATSIEGPAGGGLTLAELQAIGEEVGLPPARIAEAAARLDRPPATRRKLTVAGVPTGVRVAVDLPRAPTEREWGMLVAELRRTFGAEGRISSMGELREWRNGALHASIEPTQGGYQLRMGTRKSQAPGLVVGSVLAFLLALGSLQDGAVLGAALIAFLGLLFLGPLLRLPRWAKLRGDQMDHIGEWTTGLLRAPADPADPADLPR